MIQTPQASRASFFAISMLVLAVCAAVIVARYGVTGRFKGRIFSKFNVVPADITMSVFPGREPAPFVSSVDVPTLYAFFPPADLANGAAVLVCPGGGYHSVGLLTEGQESVRWLTKLGISVFVLKYSVKPHLYPDSTLEGFRAMRILREHAQEWKLDPHRIGVIGFSAGGHLASTIGTHFDSGNPDSPDPVERQTCRPDFMILAYAVTTMTVTTGQHSRENLIGDPPPENLIRYLSNENFVTSKTPPTFMMHTERDPSVNVKQSRDFKKALENAGVPSELVILDEATHGAHMQLWISQLTDWLVRSQIIPVQKEPPLRQPTPNRP